jgi:predicted hydrocarbon binding protein
MTLHSRLFFDVNKGQVLDANRRYILMRVDVLMGFINRLPKAQLNDHLMALQDAVFALGYDSVKAYQEASHLSSAELLDVMASSAASLGWGKWEFEMLAHGIKLSVENSPFLEIHSDDSSQTVCHAIVGMLKAVGKVIQDKTCQVREVSCCSQHVSNANKCHFEMTFV